MSRIGTGELLLIFGIVLIIFGPSRLPMIGKMTGKTLGQLKEYVDKLSEEMEEIEDTVKNPVKKKENAESAVIQKQETSDQKNEQAETEMIIEEKEE